MRLSTYTADELKRLAEPIWDRLFLVNIKYKDTLSVDHIRLHGMPTVGDSRLDEIVANELVDRYITINDMVEYFKTGVNLYIKNHRETFDAYFIIDNYLRAWKFNLDNSINIGSAPFEDLIDLDRFACILYDHAVDHFRQGNVQSGFETYTGANILSRTTSDNISQAIRPDSKRDSLEQYFSQRVFIGVR